MAQTEWYVAHTYSGYENKVQAELKKMVANQGLQDKIVEIVIPEEKVIDMVTEEQEDGSTKLVKKQVTRKLMPGYVFINMALDDSSWYVVRNIRGVTGFVGSDPQKPQPLSAIEVERLGLNQLNEGDETVKSSIRVNFTIGEIVTVVSGAMIGKEGRISAINENKGSVTVMLKVIGELETPVELNFHEVQKM